MRARILSLQQGAGSVRPIAIRPPCAARAATAWDWCGGVWREVVGREPEVPGAYSPDWAEAGGSEQLLAAAMRHLRPVAAIAPGRVLLFRWREGLPAKHCAIATGMEAMIHAHDGACVAEVALSPWWRRHLAGIFTFPDQPVRSLQPMKECP